MTEEEAKKKWCPMVRLATYRSIEGAETLYDTRGNNQGIFDCIASACMIWRWDMEYESMTEEGTGGDIVLRLKQKKGEPKRGFCGLGGREGIIG